MPGPIPRPESELARPRSRKGGNQQAVTKGTRLEVVWPAPPEHWCEMVVDLFEGARLSGQADFYQQSDIALLRIICEEINEYMTPYVVRDDDGNPSYDENGETLKRMPRRSGQMFQALMSSLQSLLLTEGDRRRVRVELAEAPIEKPKLASVARLQYADVAGGATGTEG